MIYRLVTKRQTPSKKKRKRSILEYGEEIEHERNDYENGIEDDVVLSNEEQNTTNSGIEH